MGSQKDNQASAEIPILVVGGGASGLLAAYLLSKLGGKQSLLATSFFWHFWLYAKHNTLLTNLSVKSLVIEKYSQRLAAPKAHAICPRSFELCRQFGLDTRALRQIGTSRDDAYWVNFLTNLSGERIGVLPYERMDPEVLDDTPEVNGLVKSWLPEPWDLLTSIL